MPHLIRPYEDRDELSTAMVWFRSGKAAYPFLPNWQSLDCATARSVFNQHILSKCRIWVGEQDGSVVAFLAMNGSYVDRLYVEPDYWRKGWGERLIVLAKSLSPDGLELHTHQQNHAALAFYQTQGFRVVGYGVSPPPESAPDVELCWRP